MTFYDLETETTRTSFGYIKALIFTIVFLLAFNQK